MPKAYSYKRFSSPAQMEGDSLRRQTEKAEAYALQHGLELDTTLCLEDLGKSAFKGAHIDKGALGAFIRAIDEGLVPAGSYLLVENLDRLSRQEVDIALEYFLNMTRKGIVIVTLDDGMVYSQDSIRDNWPKLIMAVAFMAGAHEQSRIKAERVGEAWSEKRKNLGTKRLTKMCPEWLKPNDQDGFDVVKEKADAIKYALELYSQGYGKGSVARMLNEQGVVSLSGTGWYKSTIHKLLLNKHVLGEFQAYKGRHPNRIPVGDPIPNYYPPIIDEDLWNRCQRAKKDTVGGKKFAEMPNVFRGLLKCPKCGGTMTTFSSKQSSANVNKTVRHLACHNYYRSTCDHVGRWHYDKFLALFLKFVTEIDLSAVFSDKSADAALITELNKIAVEIETTEKRIENVVASLMDDPSPTLNKMLRELEAKLIKIKEVKSDLEGKLIQTSVPLVKVKQEIDDAISNLEDENNRVKFNGALRRIASRIDLYPRGTGINIAPARSDEVKLDTTPSFSITFKNGLTRMVRDDGWTMKMDFSKKGA